MSSEEAKQSNSNEDQALINELANKVLKEEEKVSDSDNTQTSNERSGILPEEQKEEIKQEEEVKQQRVEVIQPRRLNAQAEVIDRPEMLPELNRQEPVAPQPAAPVQEPNVPGQMRVLGIDPHRRAQLILRRQHQENMQIMKLFDQQNLSIQSYINKSISRMIGEKNKSFAVSMTRGKQLTQHYQPVEGLYKLNYYGRSKKKDKANVEDQESKYITDKYHVKQNKVCSKELLTIQYDFLKPEYRIPPLRLGGDIRIRNLQALENMNFEREEIQIRQHQFDVIQQKYNQSFILIKNAISDYSLPYLSNFGNTSSFRLKFYPQQDIISFVGNHQVRIAQSADVTYSLGGKFRVNNLLDCNFDKVFDKNHSFIQLHIPEAGFGFQNLSSVVSCKRNNAPPNMPKYKMYMENSGYYNLNNLIQNSKLKLGMYSRHNIALQENQYQLGELKQLQVSLLWQFYSINCMDFMGFAEKKKLIQTSYGIHSKSQGQNIAIFNYAKYYEGPSAQEFNVKIKNQLFAIQMKLLQDRRLQRWTPAIDFKTTQSGYSQYLGEKYLFNNQDCQVLHNLPQFQCGFSPMEQRIALLQKVKFNDYISLNMFGCIHSTVNKKSPINFNYGCDLAIKI